MEKTRQTYQDSWWSQQKAKSTSSSYREYQILVLFELWTGSKKQKEEGVNSGLSPCPHPLHSEKWYLQIQLEEAPQNATIKETKPAGSLSHKGSIKSQIYYVLSASWQDACMSSGGHKYLHQMKEIPEQHFHSGKLLLDNIPQHCLLKLKNSN